MCTGVTGVTAHDRIKRIKHGDVDNRHCPAGTPRTELLSENAVLPRGDWSMIETAGINRDQIPAVERIEPLTWSDSRRDVCSAMKQRSKRRVKPDYLKQQRNQNSRCQANEQHENFFHMQLFSFDVLVARSFHELKFEEFRDCAEASQ